MIGRSGLYVILKFPALVPVFVMVTFFETGESKTQKPKFARDSNEMSGAGSIAQRGISILVFSETTTILSV